MPMSNQEISLYYKFLADYKLNSWCLGGESNTGRQPLQGCALPLSYPGNIQFNL